jgi:hypothetical protein
MSRSWVGFLDALSVVIPLPLLGLILVVLAAIVGLLWYFFPRWVPRRLPRFGRPRWPGWRLRWPEWRGLFKWFKRKKRSAEPDVESVLETSGDELPDLPAEVFVSLADRLAAEGRYAEAIRERLRAIVRSLVDRGLIGHRPGWTVTELARAAGSARPAVEPPLTQATALFSDVWYGQQPAYAEHDARMRALAERVGAAVGEPVPA